MRLVYPYPTALRFAALLAIFRIASIAAAMITGTAALIFDRTLLLPALVLIGVSVALILLSFAQAFSLKCVLCRCSLFLPKTCAKSPKAKTFLGSRLLEMSLDILFGTSFRCMHCGERCGCKTSRKHGHEHGGGTLPNVGPTPSTVAQVLGRSPASTPLRQIPLATQTPLFNLTSPPSPPRTQPAPRSPYPAPPAQQFPPSLLPQAPRFAPAHQARARHELWPTSTALA